MSGQIQFKTGPNGIGVLIISQPAKRNALTAQMWAAIPKTLDKARQNPELKALVIRGEGDHFASGADISEFSTLYATPESAAKISASIASAMNALAAFPLPTLALIRGACIGGGCGLALCCDIRFADHSSQFAITPAKLGLVYPYNDVQRLIETIGLPRAKDMLMSARRVSAKDAQDIGLVNFLNTADDLETIVMEYARGLATLSSQSLIVTKQMFAAYQAGQFDDNTQTQNWFLTGFSSDDFKEGYRAFMHKETPRFQ